MNIKLGAVVVVTAAFLATSAMAGPTFTPPTPGQQGAVTPPAPGQRDVAVASAAPVIIGDSLAERGGLGGSGVRGAGPASVRDALVIGARIGSLRGLPVVLSSGASNDPGAVGAVEEQLLAAQSGGASRVSLLGVGPAVEARARGTNARLRGLAQRYGADFDPLPTGPGMMSPDGVHPTATGYAVLRRNIGTQVAGPGGGDAVTANSHAGMNR